MSDGFMPCHRCDRDARDVECRLRGVRGASARRVRCKNCGDLLCSECRQGTLCHECCGTVPETAPPRHMPRTCSHGVDLDAPCSDCTAESVWADAVERQGARPHKNCLTRSVEGTTLTVEPPTKRLSDNEGNDDDR